MLTRALEEGIKNQRKQERAKIREEFEEAVSENDKELHSYEVQIFKVRTDIDRLKRELAVNPNTGRVPELENQSRFLARRIEELEAENISIVNVEKAQSKAIVSVSSLKNHNERIEGLKEESRLIKEKYRKLVRNYKEKDRQVKTLHQKVVDLDEACRKIKIEQLKKVNETDIYPDLPDIETIHQEKQTKQEEELKLKLKLKESTSKLQQAKEQLDKLTSDLKDQERQFRIDTLKAKEIKRLSNLRFNSVNKLRYLAPIEDTLPKNPPAPLPRSSSTSKSSERFKLSSHKSTKSHASIISDGSSGKIAVSYSRLSDKELGDLEVPEGVEDENYSIYEQMELLEDSEAR